MRSTHFAIAVVVAVLAFQLPCLAAHAVAADDRSELYTKKLDDGARLVVVQKEVVVSSSLRALLKTDSRTPKFLRAFLITAELRAPGAEPVVLATKLRWQVGLPDPKTAVLNVMVKQGEVVVVYSNDYAIGLWRIRFEGIGEDSFTWLPHGSEVHQAAEPITKDSVQVSLGRRDDGRWDVAVLVLLPPERAVAPTRYEQENDDWKFRVAQKWNDPH